MPEIQTIHNVYRPQPNTPLTPAPGASTTWPTTPTQPTDGYNWGQTPQYPTYPQTPGTYPTYPQQPGTYPGYPAAPVQGASLGWLGGLVTGAVAGMKAIGGFAFNVARKTVRRRSPSYYSGAPRGYGAQYYTRGGSRAYSSGRARVGTRAKVGMSGNFMERMFGAVKTSAIIGTAISIVTNGWDLMQKRITFAQAGSNVVGDSMSSVVGGAGGAIASSIATAMLAGVVGTGLGATLVALGAGIGGYMLADSIFRKTSFFQNVTGKVYTALA